MIRLGIHVGRLTVRLVETVTSVVGIASGIYVATLTLVGARSRSTPPAPLAPRTRFTILVPAHDEAAGIAPTLRSLSALAYPSTLFDVHVVADNCHDDTAAVVRAHGLSVHERTDLEHPGKGPALNWLLDRVLDEADTSVDVVDGVVDGVVVVDADTIVDPGFLAAMDAELRTGSVAAQGHYSVREPLASTAASFRYAALACRHHLRPLARNRLGGSCGLFGNGMVFRTDVLRRHRWTGHLVEDAELQAELLLDGVEVRYVPEARLWAEMPDSMEQADSQNARWERGRLDLMRRYVPRMLARAREDRTRAPAYVDAALDLALPPLSVVAAAQMTATALATLRPISRRRPPGALAVLNASALGATIVHALWGLRSVEATRAHYLALVSAPRLVAWKVALWIRTLRPTTNVEWVRTTRKHES